MSIAITLKRAKIYMLKNKASSLESGKDFPGRDSQVEQLREQSALLELELLDERDKEDKSIDSV